jgi:rhomboid protease GluP
MAFTGLVFVAQSISLAMTGQDWLLAYGVKARAPILNGQWWRLITPIFLHLSLSHIFVNMFSLYALAPQIERFFGSWRMLTFYLISGVGGVGFSLALSDNPSAGASGAIFGVVGALGTFIYLHQKFLGRMGRQQLGRIAMITLLNLALGLSPGIDNWAHIGGLVTGIGLTFWFGPRLEPVPVSEGQLSLVDRRPWAGVQGGVAIAAVAVISLAVAAAYAFS